MIISRTPFRVSFAGGGTDLRAFYARHGYGAVVSAAIRRYMYIVIHPYFQDKIRIKYSRTEDVESVDEIRHPIVRECLRRVGVETGVEIASFADIASGTGLGSSSAFTVGLLHALYAHQGEQVRPQQLAEEACEVEIDILGEPIGKQDQYAAAFGGVNYLRFGADERVEVVPLPLSQQTRGLLEQNLRLYYLGGRRDAGMILADQKKGVEQGRGGVDERLCRMRALADACRLELTNGAVDKLGGILHAGWLCKREVAAGITSSRVDEVYQQVMASGATGAKLLGAGGTGFLLVAHPDHETLSASLGLRHLAFEIESAGSTIIFQDTV